LFKGLSDIGYKIFNLAYRDFINGGQFLQELEKKYNCEFISTNTYFKDSGKRFTQPYIIKTLKSQKKSGTLPFNKIKVGAVGLCDEYGLLFNGNYKLFKSVMDQVKGIDVAVMGGQYYMVTPNETYNAIVVTTPSMGKYGGILTLELDKNKKIVSHSTQQIPLKEDMKDDPEIVKLVEEFEQAEKKLQDSQIYSTE